MRKGQDEIEVKVLGEGVRILKEFVKEKGNYRGTEYLISVYLDHKKLSLHKNEAVLRVRKGIEVDVTFKKAKEKGGVKVYDEIEVKVNSFDDALALFESMGFKEILRLEKWREKYLVEFQGDELEVVFDRIERPIKIGEFAEVEGHSKDVLIAFLKDLSIKEEDVKDWDTFQLLEKYNYRVMD